MNEWEQVGRSLMRQQERIEELTNTLASVRAVLQTYEWEAEAPDKVYCRTCQADANDGHTADCAVAIALGSTD